MPLQYRATPLELVEIKAEGGSMTFTAYASTFGNVDHGGDIIEKGAFAQSLKERKYRPLLWQHNMDEPIGIEKSLREDNKGLVGTWELVDTARGLEAYKLLKAGAVRSMSIGYIPKKWEFQQEDAADTNPFTATRLLKAVDLLENSVVSLPMNEQALVQSVKQHIALDCVECVAEAMKNAFVASAHNGHHSHQASTPKHDPERSTEAVSYEEMSLAELAGVVNEVIDVFGVRTRDLLSKLSAGGFEINESKRTDFQKFLETFSGLDSVRHEVEQVLAEKSTTDPKPSDSGISAVRLAIELRRKRLRAGGMEI